MTPVYLDSAATSFPKPPEVIEAVVDALQRYGNAGRGRYQMARDGYFLVESARRRAASFFGAGDPRQVVFCSGATDAINMGLKGYLTEGDHVIVTQMAHNSVLRPLRGMNHRGEIELSVVPVGPDGLVRCEEIEAYITSNTRLIVISHISNVVGTIQPVRSIGRLCRQHDIRFMMDASQSAGILRINLSDLGVDLMALSGHKGLLGPSGIGLLYVREGLNLKAWREGGTGSLSSRPLQPEDMPEKLEAGTPNIPGIAGLKAGIDAVDRVGITNIFSEIESRTLAVVRGLKEIPGVVLYGLRGEPDYPLGVISFNILGLECHETAMILEQSFDCLVRSGLHCAPEAHKALETWPEGTVRVSLGYMTDSGGIRHFLDAVRKITDKLN